MEFTANILVKIVMSARNDKAYVKFSGQNKLLHFRSTIAKFSNLLNSLIVSEQILRTCFSQGKAKTQSSPGTGTGPYLSSKY